MERKQNYCAGDNRRSRPAGEKRKRKRSTPPNVDWSGQGGPSFRSVDYLHDNYLRITFDDGVSVEMDMYPAFLTVIEMMRCSECGAHLLKLLEPEHFLDFTFDTKFIYWDRNRFSISALMLYPICMDIKRGCYGKEFGK